MLRNAASKSALIVAKEAGTPGSLRGLITVYPVIIGGKPGPPQAPKSPRPPTVTALHVAVGSSTTFPLIRVVGAVLVSVTPAVAAIPNVEADPRFTDGADGAHIVEPTVKFHTTSAASGVPFVSVAAVVIVAV
jgi:hypothetical protein